MNTEKRNEFKPKGAVAFMVVMIFVYALIWLAVWIIMASRG